MGLKPLLCSAGFSGIDGIDVNADAVNNKRFTVHGIEHIAFRHVALVLHKNVQVTVCAGGSIGAGANDGDFLDTEAIGARRHGKLSKVSVHLVGDFLLGKVLKPLNGALLFYLLGRRPFSLHSNRIRFSCSVSGSPAASLL